MKYSFENSDYFAIRIFGNTFIYTLSPFQEYSKNASTSSVYLSSDESFHRLNNDFKQWLKLVIEDMEIESPLETLSDPIIKFYANEIIEDIEFFNDDKLPFSSKYHSKIHQLLNSHERFISDELKNENESENPELSKINELGLALEITNRLNQDLPRLTKTEILNNWSIVLSVIKKWSYKAFLAYLRIDQNTEYRLSKSIGSLFGSSISGIL